MEATENTEVSRPRIDFIREINTCTMKGINDGFISYWRHSGYKTEQVDEICRAAEMRFMFVRVLFDGNGSIGLTLSQRTWDRKEGHVASVSDAIEGIARHPRMRGLKGSFIVWLEDGLWDPESELARFAPILTFGRTVRDTYSGLIPDPAFLESCGYSDEIQEIRGWSEGCPWGVRIPKIFWRGAASGIGIEGPDWAQTPRGRFVSAAHEFGDPSIVDAKFTRISHLKEDRRESILNAGFVGEETPFRDFIKYKYSVDVDGYCCAWKSLFLKLVSGCATLKVASQYEQWYFRHLTPWVNLIPLSYSAHDLKSVQSWLVHNDRSAQEIAARGNEITKAVSFENSYESLVHVCAETLKSCRVD